MGITNMIRITSVFATCLVLTGAVTPLTPEELQQIRDFTAKAHMKRLQAYPDQIMTPSTHYLGRRLPAPAQASGENKQPSIFMQVPNTNNANAAASKPQPVQVEPQPAQAVQNYLTYPLAPHPPQGPPPPPGGPLAFLQQRLVPQHLPPPPQQHPQQQQQQQQSQQPQTQLQFVPVQGGPGGPLRGPPQQIQIQQQYNKRPSFFSFTEAVPPTSSILEFFFPRRPASPRRPISFRPPFRLEFGQVPPSPAMYQHQQSLQTVMAQQHLNTLQQQQQAQANQAQAQAQQSVVQQSTAPHPGTGPAASGPSGPSAPAPGAQNPNQPQVATSNQRPQFPPSGFPSPLRSPLAFLNHYRELPFFKAFGKPLSAPKYPQPNTVTIVPPQSRPGEVFNAPQQHEFSFIPNGPHLPPPVVVPGPGPNNKPFNNPPVSFSHMEQMPFNLGHPPHGPRPLPMAMMVQGQQFPHYQFATQFGAGNQGPVPAIAASAQSQVPKEGQASSTIQQTVRQTQRVKKVRARPNGPTTTPNPSSTTQNLGQVIFESSKETREFHDSARIVSPNANSNIRKQKHHHIEHGNLPKASVETSSVVLAPLVFTEDSSGPVTSPRPLSSTSVSVSTVVTTTQEPHKAKIVKATKVAEYHKTKSDKKVTASGSGLGAVTVEPMRISTASSHKSTPGRVVTTSVTSRVVSSGPKVQTESQNQQNSQKRYRLRKVKVPNPEANKGNKGSDNTTNAPTTSTSSRSRPTTTLSSTESSFTTEI